ncbi:Glycoside hydrolase [Trema orientale]|uniref:Glycoside hydrolase n=1 Tax=Trema orientale TaxID=63057 RepID=A0A2P5FJ47_TREOI|nr:Glycoside hydrolase [Trema orientale]
MSGGIRDVRAEDLVATDTKSGIRIKTTVGRGGFVKDIFIRRMTMKNMRHVFLITGNYRSHPDNGYDPKALPLIHNINFRDMVAENVRMAAQLDGISGDPFTGICVSNVTIGLANNAEKLQWNCTDVSGISSGVPLFEMVLLLAIVLVLVSTTNGVESRKGKVLVPTKSFEYSAMCCRSHIVSLTDFGGVGDGTTSNTKSFQAAISHLSRFSSDGGSLLFVPPGKWLTGSFNLTSNFTLFLHKDAVLLGSQDENEWPVIAPLPSYGQRFYTEAGRFSSLIFGTNLTDVIITGDNGTIHGQGELWWQKHSSGELKHERPFLIELMFSQNVQISNLTLVNSPNWNIHPVYCSNVIIQGITILAPVTSPNTDGINPDSCTNTRIEDCYIVSGDDCVAVKSGLDQHGIAFGMPTKHLMIRRLTCISPRSAVIALGSEMSGGIQDVRVEDIVAVNSESGVRIKTGRGRGGYVKDIHVRRMSMRTMRWVFWMTGSYGSHADNGYDPNALPVIHNINYLDMVAENVTMAAQLDGISGDPFTGICISNVTIGLADKAKELQWSCTDVGGISSGVVPKTCELLKDQGPEKRTTCDFPKDILPIDDVKLKKCSFRGKCL